MEKRSGFTLAEVLITLGIIGVVAAMTIPTLINGTTAVQYKTALKKMISSISNAADMNFATDDVTGGGVGFDGLTEAGAVTTNRLSLYDLLNRRMQVVSTATDASALGTTNPVLSTNYTLFFTDGMAISYPKAAKNCTAAVDYVIGNTTNPCKALLDVNGSKGPNAAIAETTTGTTANIKDRYSVQLVGQSIVYPNGANTRYALSN